MRAALDLSQGRGLVAVNVMKAVRDHPALVRQACESGAHAIVMGAGLPMDLPEMTADHPKVSLIPILSEARGVAVVLKKWLKKGRMADAVVIEHPGHAGGHLGAASWRMCTTSASTSSACWPNATSCSRSCNWAATRRA